MPHEYRCKILTKTLIAKENPAKYQKNCPSHRGLARSSNARWANMLTCVKASLRIDRIQVKGNVIPQDAGSITGSKLPAKEQKGRPVMTSN